jgi:hypothetical protein
MLGLVRLVKYFTFVLAILTLLAMAYDTFILGDFVSEYSEVEE